MPRRLRAFFSVLSLLTSSRHLPDAEHQHSEHFFCLFETFSNDLQIRIFVCMWAERDDKRLRKMFAIFRCDERRISTEGVFMGSGWKPALVIPTVLESKWWDLLLLLYVYICVNGSEAFLAWRKLFSRRLWEASLHNSVGFSLLRCFTTLRSMRACSQ